MLGRHQQTPKVMPRALRDAGGRRTRPCRPRCAARRAGPAAGAWALRFEHRLVLQEDGVLEGAQLRIVAREVGGGEAKPHAAALRVDAGR